MILRFRALTAICTFFLGFHAASAADWYVSGTGDDTHAGTSTEAAFRSLQKAADLVQAGDTVLVGDGIYSNGETAEDSSVLRLSRSGRPDAWITWKAAPGAHPVVRPTGWNGIMVTGSYNIIDGLAVTGINDSLVLIQALADANIKEKNGKKYVGDPRFNTNGIFITGRLNGPDDKPHHIIVRNCTVSKCPGGGITGIETDYLTIEDNLVFENAWYMRYGGSGISTLNNWAYDDKPGYHVVIQRNQVWDNKTIVPWHTIGKLSDGNGIILDVSDAEANGAANPEAATNPNADAAVATPTPSGASPPPGATPKAPRPEWKGRSLVANNLSAYSGGSGIHTFRHKHADIVNNTTYWNGCNVGYAELFANRSDDIVILNNIIIPRPAGAVTSNNHNGTIRWDYNIYPEKQNFVTGPHDIVGDPLFVKIARDLRDADFRLRPESPALDSGTDELSQPKDVVGQPRPAGKGRDRGAFEQ